jgi:hypothetical protein
MKAVARNPEIIVRVPEDRSFTSTAHSKASPGNCERCMCRGMVQRPGGIQHECIVEGTNGRKETVEFCSSCFFEVTIGRQDFI